MANGFSAGDLDLSIQTVADNTIKSLDAVLERLTAIQKGLGAIGGFAKSSGGYIRKTQPKSHTEKTYSVGRFGKEYLTMQKDIQRAENQLKSITTQFDKHGKVIKKTSIEVDEYGNKITKIFGGGKKSTKGGGLTNITKLGINIYLLRRMGRGLANIVQAGSDYTETLNLWQVAMRDNLDVADQFINKMNKAYGISTKTLMNAQAIFKNMIGSLGQISDQTAYKLSEALVQMSADFSSLYNVQLESAFEKMQSMLAGQVRPIRSAGLDMTETTLFMFYQQLGGTKTMRQLNRTEKQLLSILAVYQQMGSAGALGDMTKTLNQFANQSRMMTEYWQELKTWSGLLLKDWIDQSQILVHINALLIFMTEIVKAIAKSRGLGEENFINGMFETTEATNDEIDELQGKLLDFDKFRSLEGATASPLAIDEKLLEAITGYSSKIDEAQNAAQKLAETFKVASGLFDESGIFNEEKWNEISDNLTTFGIVLGGIIGLKFFATMTSGLLTFVTNAIKFIPTLIKDFKALSNGLGLLSVTVFMLVVGISSFISAWDDMTAVERAISILATLAATITAVAIAFHATHNWAKALMIGGIVAGGTMLVASSLATIDNYEDGASDIDSGTIFRAGEFGKTEAVYTGSNGKTNVANIQQMKAAELQALNEWWAKAKHDIPAFQGVSDSGIYTIVDGEAKRRGKKFANV